MPVLPDNSGHIEALQLGHGGADRVPIDGVGGLLGQSITYWSFVDSVICIIDVSDGQGGRDRQSRASGLEWWGRGVGTWSSGRGRR